MIKTVKKMMTEYYDEQSHFTGRFKNSNSKSDTPAKISGNLTKTYPDKNEYVKDSTEKL